MENNRDLFEDVKNKSCLLEISDIKFECNRDIVLDSLLRLDFSVYSLHQLEDMADYVFDKKISFASSDEAKEFFKKMAV